MRLTLKNLQDLAKKKGLVVEKTTGSLFKYQIKKKDSSSSAVYARSAGETQYEIENWS